MQGDVGESTDAFGPGRGLGHLKAADVKHKKYLTVLQTRWRWAGGRLGRGGCIAEAASTRRRTRETIISLTWR